MILADKIMNERKRNGWSQEELAEKLSVSRQSVSKWEGAQSVPDLTKILQMAELFGVSTDYLLKDDMEEEVSNKGELVVSSDSIPPLRKVSMEEAQAFLAAKKTATPWIALAVSMFITSPVVLIFLAGLAESKKYNISENLAAGIGVITLLLMVALGVVICMFAGSKVKGYEFLETEMFETAYGVSGMVKEKKQQFSGKHMTCNAIGVVICILCSIPLLVSAFVGASGTVICSMVCVLLLLVALAVYIFVRANAIMGSYDMLLCEGEYTEQKKNENKSMQAVSAIYWSLATCIFFGYSFYTRDWGRSWIVWPVAGIGYAVVRNIALAIRRSR